MTDDWLAEVGRSDEVLPGVIARSRAMKEVAETTRRVARASTSVLLVGETGTGKELIARAIHHLSQRATGPFVRVNCGALSEGLLESELFGHVKGAFTGAIANRTGRFEAAHTGTIFLDEISATSLQLQVKLLRVLQEGEFERVGDTQTIRVDVRVIAATNQDLEAEIRAGRFREDLFYRLNVVQIDIPPLRQRREDIPLMVRHFVEQFCTENDKPLLRVTREAMEILVSYDWPGNVRELQNCIERTVVLAQGREIRPEDLPPRVRGERTTSILRSPVANSNVDALARELVQLLVQDAGPLARDLYDRTMRLVERELLQTVLREVGGIQIRAADRLGINRNTLYRKLRELGLANGGSPGD
jgi:DNA-binding NtrC family response regulator